MINHHTLPATIASLLIVLSVLGCERSSAPENSQSISPSNSNETTAKDTIATPIIGRDPGKTDTADGPHAGSMHSDSGTPDPVDSQTHDSTEDSTEDATVHDSETTVHPDSAEEVIAEVPPSIAQAPYRLWLPTSKGPLIVGLDVLINDGSLLAAFDQKIRQVNQGIENDPKKELDWDTLLAHVSANAAVFGQASARINGQEKGLIKRFDRNQNGTADQDEFARFIFRESRFATEFRLFGTDAFRWSNRSNSRLFRAIDRNDDRKIDESEVQVAEQSLLREVDRNADQCIDLAEAVNPDALEEDPWQSNRSNRQGNVAMDLSGFVNWGNLSYAMGGMVKSNPVFASVNPVRLIDSDADGWISSEEAQTIMELPPAFNLIVRLDDTTAAPAAIEIQLLQRDDLKLNTLQLDSNRLWVTGPALRVGVSIHESLTNRNRIPRQAFDQIDANKDGGIDESEIPDGAEDQIDFESLDVNNDGMLSYQEINQTPRKPESIWNVQVRARAAEHPDAFFAWLDVDHDQFLSTREILSASDRLRESFKRPGGIRPMDIPDSYMIQLGRGEPSQDDTRFQIQRPDRKTKEGRPVWVLRMDANKDGDVSQNEFVGPIKLFEKLDTDGDHFLSDIELTSIEQQ